MRTIILKLDWYLEPMAVAFVLIYAVVPVIIHCFSGTMQYAFFLNFVKLPFTNYENLSAHNVTNKGRNFYLQANGVRLGVWHVLPRSLSVKMADTAPTDAELELTLRSERFPVIIYLHGTAFDRTGGHRCRLYNVLTSLDFHVIAFDYRGYGDSTGTTSEDGMIEDAKEIYQYAQRMSGQNPVYIWGHSMGTGVATKAAMDISEEGRPPIGLILESPFNNLRDAVSHHPLTLVSERTSNFSDPFRWMPFFDEIFVHTMRMDMRTDERIVKVNCPILILHAKDDYVVPHDLACKLRQSAENAGRDVTFVDFAKERRFLHLYIFRAQELSDIIKSFVHKCSSARATKN